MSLALSSPEYLTRENLDELAILSRLFDTTHSERCEILKDVSLERASVASAVLFEGIVGVLENNKSGKETKSFKATVPGTMFGSKTTLAVELAAKLRELGVDVGHFRLAGDTRYNVDGSHIGTNGRDGESNLHPVEGAYGSLEDIMNMGEEAPAVIIISEAAFWRGDRQKFLDWIEETGRCFVGEGLGLYFNGDSLESMHEFVGRSDISFPMYGVDMETGMFAEGTIRYDTYKWDGEKWVLDVEEGIEIEVSYDLNKGIGEDPEVANWIEGRSFIKGGVKKVKIPSHPADPPFRIGGPDSYEPKSIIGMLAEYRVFGMEIPKWPTHDDHDYLGYPSFYVWDGLRLVKPANPN
ncbi:MAG TPA: hypothetical protein ENI23_07925 [bacterium]|nr:hypothetical protein [bacterium]